MKSRCDEVKCVSPKNIQIREIAQDFMQDLLFQV